MDERKSPWRWFWILGAVLLALGWSASCSTPEYAGLAPQVDGGTECVNGVLDGTETDVDCGGNCPTGCAVRQKCRLAADCQSKSCVSGKCAAPTCTDGAKNGTESDKNCGGDSCPKCAVGAACVQGSDCESASCSMNLCAAPSCTDGVQNQGEKFVDCGGPCALCAVGSPCTGSSDCVSGVCNVTCQAGNCTDGAKNGAETGVDCGGGTCPKCPVGQGCLDGPQDCQNGVCTSSICQAAHCNDGTKNGGETDKDCGGADCGACGTGMGCSGPTDCLSKVCTGNICQAPSCTDGVQNGTESYVDCGRDCGGCATGQACVDAVDCQSLVCTGSVCQAPSCVPADGARNGTETDVDCGGTDMTCPRCANTMACVVGTDCQNGVCVANPGPALTCQAPSCFDVVKNGTESDTDCGGGMTTCAAGDGPCARCDVSRPCNCGADCQSGVCGVNNSCPAPPCACQASSCGDSVKNGTETDIDCGGSCAPGKKCADGRNCAVPGDCTSGVCGTGNSCPAPPCLCIAPLCNPPDGVKNGNESDVDCGGTAAGCPRCADGQKCNSVSDCIATHVCNNGQCGPNSCQNMTLDPGETDKDCGGTTCGPCANGLKCVLPRDCQSGICDTSGNPDICKAPSCGDGIKNGTETDVDCGGPDMTCPRCANNLKCVSGTDCVSKVCGGTGSTCQPPSCNPTDGVKNGTETDIDCGGACVASTTCTVKCADGKACLVACDCVNGICTANKCAAPSCTDGIKNQNETDKDCGGICGATCLAGQICIVAGDCLSRACVSGLCSAYSCTGSGEFFLMSTGSCYKDVHSAVPCDSAEASCVTWGGHLATISTSQENTDLSNYFISIGSTNLRLMGAYNPSLNGTWRWRSGETWSSTFWCSAEPCTCDICGELDVNGTCWRGGSKAWYLCEHN